GTPGALNHLRRHTARSIADLESHGGHQLCQHDAILPSVVSDQNAVDRLSRFEPNGAALFLPLLDLGARRQPDFETEGRSLTFGAPDTNVPAHQSHKITADRQSQTGPLFRLYAAPALSKGLEDSLLLRFADARPRVFNLEGRHPIPPRSPQRNAAG